MTVVAALAFWLRGNVWRTTAAVDLLAAINFPGDVIEGRWRREGVALVCDGLKEIWHHPRLKVQFAAPAEYELTAVVERLAGDDGVEFGVVMGGRPVRLILDGFTPRLCGLELIDGKPIIAWQGDAASFSAAPYYALENPQPFWIGAPNMPDRFHRWEVRALKPE